jgi:hypothetical protein
MKKKPRVYVWDSRTGRLSNTIPEGTFIQITDNDVLLPANWSRGLTTNLDHRLKQHMIPREILQPKTTATDPPVLAEFLLTLLATTRRADAMIGDLNERFTRECREFGRDRAVRLYWARALRSLGPLLWRAIGKVVISAVKRIFGLSGA